MNREDRYQRRIKRISKKEIRQEKIEKKQIKLEKLEQKLKRIKDKELTKQRKIIIKRNNNVKWLILIFIISIFTGLLTPIKDIPYTYMIKSLMGNTMKFIQEHQSVELIHSVELLLSLFAIQVLLFSSKIKIRLQDIFMLGGMSILALISYKQFPIFWIAAMYIINKLAGQIVDDNIKEKITSPLKYILSLKGMIYTTLILVVLFLVQYKQIAPQSYINSNEYPVLATRMVKRKHRYQKNEII